MSKSVSFNTPSITDLEERYVLEALRSGHLHGDGPWTRRAEAILRDMTGCKHVLLTTSCTSALEIAALLAGVGPGDEVIVPSFTFVSTVNAFVLRGATPIFVDVRSDTLNMDENAVRAAMTERTRAIVPVHYAGTGCEMNALRGIADEWNCLLIEDAAQAVDASYRGAPLGTQGDLAAFSFHATKNHGSGEGGALLINRDGLAERAEMVREKGTNRSQFFRGQVDKYTWVDVGSSFIPSDLLAALLVAQLERRAEILASRTQVAEAYDASLAPVFAAGHLVRPQVPSHCTTNHHMYAVLAADLTTRTALLGFLKQRGIAAAFHYVPLHTSPMGRTFGGYDGQLPVTEDIADRLLRLPMHAELGEAEIAAVTAAVLEFYSAS